MRRRRCKRKLPGAEADERAEPTQELVRMPMVTSQRKTVRKVAPSATSIFWGWLRRCKFRSRRAQEVISTKCSEQPRCSKDVGVQERKQLQVSGTT